MFSVHTNIPGEFLDALGLGSHYDPEHAKEIGEVIAILCNALSIDPEEVVQGTMPSVSLEALECMYENVLVKGGETGLSGQSLIQFHLMKHMVRAIVRRLLQEEVRGLIIEDVSHAIARQAVA